MRSWVQWIVLTLLMLGGTRYFSSHFTPQGLLARADDLAITDGCAAAIPVYDRAIEFGAGFDGYARRATCQTKLKQYDAALDGWRDASGADQADPAPHLARAALLRRLGRPDEALQEYDRATALDPDTDIRLLQASLLNDSGKLDQAKLAYKELMNRTDAPNAASRASFKYAEIQLALGDAPGAIASVEQALQQWPDDALGLYDRGVFRLMIEHRPDDAAADLARSIEAGEKYRSFSMILDAGIAALDGKPTDRSPHFSYFEPYLPIAMNAILFLDAARARSGQDGSGELKKNFDDLEFASRPAGSLQPATLKRWPTPIVKYYLNEIGPRELFAQAEEGVGVFQVPPICSANLFAGINPEKSADAGEIQRRLRLSADKCPATSLEHSLAAAALSGEI